LRHFPYALVASAFREPDNKKNLESAYVASCGEINQIDNQPASKGEKKPVSKAVKEYLDNCDDRKGKSGYGLAVRTPESYEYRLGLPRFPMRWIISAGNRWEKASLP
jgi:hypothetical protein